MSALLGKIEKKETIQKKVEIEVDLLEDLELYMVYNGAINLKDNDGFNYIINESLKYVFSKDKNFKKFKKELEEKKNDNIEQNEDEKNKEVNQQSSNKNSY